MFYEKKLGQYSLKDLYQMIDYKEISLDKRMEIVKEICENEFFRIYFDDVYNPHLNKSDSLSENDSVCRLLERLADYILLSEEEQQQRKESGEYLFFSSREHLQSKLKKELKFSELLTDNVDIDSIILYNIEQNASGNIEIKDVEVTKTDFKDKGVLGKVLNAYKDLLVRVENDDELTRQDKQKHQYSIIKDMKTVKQYYTGAIDYNRKHMPNTSKDYPSDIHFTPEILKGFTIEVKGRPVAQDGLLHMKNEGLDENNPITFWLDELDRAIDSCGLTDREKEILTYIRDGYKQNEIASLLNVSAQYIHTTYKNIIEKIIKQGE